MRRHLLPPPHQRERLMRRLHHRLVPRNLRYSGGPSCPAAMMTPCLYSGSWAGVCPCHFGKLIPALPSRCAVTVVRPAAGSSFLHEPPGCCPARRGAREQPPPRAAHARVLRPFVPIFGPAFSALPCNLQAGNVYSSSNSMRNCVSRCIQSCSSVPRQPPRAAPRSAGASMVTGGTDDRRCYDTSCGFWN